jgi:hypothetical protein
MIDGDPNETIDTDEIVASLATEAEATHAEQRRVS